MTYINNTDKVYYFMLLGLWVQLTACILKVVVFSSELSDTSLICILGDTFGTKLKKIVILCPPPPEFFLNWRMKVSRQWKRWLSDGIKMSAYFFFWIHLVDFWCSAAIVLRGSVVSGIVVWACGWCFFFGLQRKCVVNVSCLDVVISRRCNLILFG